MKIQSVKKIINHIAENEINNVTVKTSSYIYNLHNNEDSLIDVDEEDGLLSYTDSKRTQWIDIESIESITI